LRKISPRRAVFDARRTLRADRLVPEVFFFFRYVRRPGAVEMKWELVSWSLTSLVSTNMAISETKMKWELICI